MQKKKEPQWAQMGRVSSANSSSSISPRGDLGRLMTLYEDDAMFPTTRSTASGLDVIRAVLKGYLDSGAKLVFGESLVSA